MSEGALFAACSSRNFDEASALARDRIGLQHQKLDGSTVLHCAIEKDAPIELIKLFLELGLDANAERRYLGITAMHLAAKHSRADVIPLLVQFGGIVDKKSCMSATPLLMAANSNATPSTVLALLQAGADIHHVDEDMHGCMYWAIQCSCLPTLARVLLENGADPNLKTKKSNRSAVEYAIITNSSPAVFVLLLQFGGSVEDALVEAKNAEKYALVATLQKTRILLCLSTPRARRSSKSPARLFPADLTRILALML